MHLITSYQSKPQSSTITMLPIINMYPSNMSCIYSTLLFVKDQSQTEYQHPFVTFDQPLCIEAVEIVSSKSLGIVVRLGGFHCLMSFVGSIGSLMEGSGLEKLLETVNGNYSHMSGKAISRTLRGHFLVNAALRIKLLASVCTPEMLPECQIRVSFRTRSKCRY